MALAYSTNELQVLHDELLAIQEVEQVFVQLSKTSLEVLVTIQQHNSRLERRLTELESRIADAFPSLEIDFDIVFLQGRALADVVSPKGFQLFARWRLPAKEEHLEKAERNEQLARLLATTSFKDWAVTVYFYSILHYAHAVLAVYGQHPRSHEATAPLVRTNQVLRKIWHEYRMMQIASRNARYYVAEITPQHLHDIQVAYNVTSAYIRSELGVKSEEH
jgi:uncharacterized protein (UPF0332 family)